MDMLDPSEIARAEYMRDPISQTSVSSEIDVWKRVDTNSSGTKLFAPHIRNAFSTERASLWSNQLSDASGGESLANLKAVERDVDDEEDRTSEAEEDRLTLLAKKYAANRTGLTREQGARLEMINWLVDASNPRYTERDYQPLKESTALLDELLQGDAPRKAESSD